MIISRLSLRRFGGSLGGLAIALLTLLTPTMANAAGIEAASPQLMVYRTPTCGCGSFGQKAWDSEISTGRCGKDAIDR